MKKLGLIFVVFLSIFFGTLAEKTYAAISSGELSTITEESKQAIRSTPGITNIGNKYPQYLLQVDTIVREYSSNSANADDSYYAAAAKINKALGQYLAGQTGSSNYVVGVEMTARNNDATVSAFSAINNLYMMYDSNEKVRTGAITQEEAQKRIDSRALTNAGLSRPIAAVNNPTPDKCSFVPLNFTACITDGVTWLIKSILLEIAGFLLWLSANMINYAIQVGILDFKSWAPDTLYPIWIVVRQIVSLFVVFAGLWLGLMYIIGKDETFEKYIPWVVIFALFVNFSYPLVRTAVDISNVVSLNIYASAVGNDALTGTSNSNAGSLIMTRLGLGGLMLSATTDKVETTTSMVTKINSVPGALMAVVFVLYASYILFMITGIIIMRTIALVFLIIASPILFIDSVIPRLGDEAVKLRKIFFEQLTVGPVFMIMLALTLKFIGIFSGVAKAGGGGTHSTVVEFFNLAMMLIMLHIMLKITKETAGGIGQMATNAMGKVGGFAGGMAMGGAGLLARGTVGRLAAKARDSKWVTNNQDGMLGRHAYNMSNSVAKSSFDARNSSYVQTGAKKLGLSMGMGANTNYEKELDSKIQDRKERYARIKTENADGTTNEDGAKAKQNFFASQGMVGGNKFSKALGFAQNKEKVGNALASADREQAEAQDKKMAAYDKRTGEAKQEKFYTEKDQAMQNQMIESDRAKAEAENKKIDQYDNLSNKSRQIFYGKQSDDVKDAAYKRDELEASSINTNIDNVNKMNLEDYSKMTNEDKQRYYSNQSDSLKQKLKAQDQTQATNTDKNIDEIQKRANTSSQSSSQQSQTNHSHTNDVASIF
jgi:hypothetical protein